MLATSGRGGGNKAGNVWGRKNDLQRPRRRRAVILLARRAGCLYLSLRWRGLNSHRPRVNQRSRWMDGWMGGWIAQRLSDFPLCIRQKVWVSLFRAPIGVSERATRRGPFWLLGVAFRPSGALALFSSLLFPSASLCLGAHLRGRTLIFIWRTFAGR